MVAASPTPSFPGAWPDLSSTDIAALPPLPDIPDKFVVPQDLSPSLVCLSPRPLQELPSLSSSLSTADSCTTSTSSSPVLPEEYLYTPTDAQTTCTPQTDCSPAILDLREPRSPDPAHFSPVDVDDVISSFPSPTPSQLEHSPSNNCQGAPSAESVATYLPSPSSPPAPEAESIARQDEENHPDPPGEETASPCSRSDVQEHVHEEEPVNRATSVPIGKRTFLNKVKRIGGRVRKLFKTRTVETKPRRNSVSSLVSPRRPSLSVSVRLPAALPESPASRQGSEPPLHSITRRFSLQSLLHSRLPRESTDASSRATVGSRLPTVVSAREAEGDWLTVENTSLLVPGIVRTGVQSNGDLHEKTGESEAV